MKTTKTMWVMLIALLTVTSCSETETGIDPEPGNDDQVSLGITPNLKVDAGTKAVTKSVVSGETITYPVEQFTSSDYAPGLGVLVTNSGTTGWYTPDGTEYTGHHIWYMGDEKGANWISIKEKKDTYKSTKETPYYLTKEVGKVYAYYPYDPDLSLSINRESDLKIPVTVLSSGKIDATANNAKKYWKTNAWAATAKADLVNLSLSTEKDYLYFAGEEGRYVNNGRASGETPVASDADPDNKNEKNPGYKINLDMKHAMAMISFRVYDGGHLSDKDVNFTKFEIKNHTGGSNLFKTGDGKMALTDGAITETSTTTSLSRTVTNYILMRQIDEGGTEGEHAFIATGTSTSSINGKNVSRTVSAVIYPIINFGDNEIDVEVTLQESSGSSVVYPITLPGNAWEAGTNYIYTFSAGRNKLTIMDVAVEAWVDNEQDEIPL
ncbi:fimbrillin family protein [Parabacteroides faecis]|uniref:fimbrillin family protein n=1 Tax=Parabacteroides faecis TaxID=1217282 RepID=UPI00216497C0|nr:fimbrillin family protein [Parabacteroides faecis]MCS2893687.1 fimbrillin family protein [Parabacteroides faecis]UVQ47722.1 fimbrillin family protein [Parabacteroides faecis]